MTDNEHDGMKKCTKCGEWKPATAEYFYADSANRDGFRGSCLGCAREYYEKNKDKFAERWHKYHEKNKDKIAERQREYNRSNVGRLSDAVNKIRKKTGATIYLRDMTDEEKETLANQYVAVRTLEKTEKKLLSSSGKKRCTKCDRILDYDCFYKKNDGYAGVEAYCKACASKQKRQKKNKKALDKTKSIPDTKE